MTQADLFSTPPRSKSAFVWEPTCRAGLAQLSAFVPRIGTYAKERNFDFGPTERHNISLLSPWIRRRLISEEEVLSATLARYRPSTAEKFIQEVFWRGYFKGWLEQHPAVWCDYENRLSEVLAALDKSVDQRDLYETALAGRTGIDCFDAWAHELATHGYLHNHARMWFASIWIFTLKLPWQLGAHFFYRHLLDADAASNTLSWRWVAGLHTKGKTYLARSDNIHKFTNGRFDGNGKLAKFAEPIEEIFETTLSTLPASTTAFPTKTGKLGLLITEEDVSADWIPSDTPISAICGVVLSVDAPLSGRAPLAQAFAEGAVENALGGCQERFNAPTHLIESKDPVQEIVTWAREAQLQHLAMAYQPIGPLSQTLNALSSKLSDIGIHLHVVRRAYDDLVWPHATRGFFKVKDKIPRLIAQLGL